MDIRTLIIGLLVGLLIGAGGGYYLGMNVGDSSRAADEGDQTQNPLAEVKTNPLEDVKTNPFDVKTNPFE